MNKKRGVTLIALIITIVVLLILVAVSVNVLIKNNIIGVAEKTTNKYKTSMADENAGKVTIKDKEYDSVEDYVAELNKKDITFYYNNKAYTVKERNNMFRIFLCIRRWILEERECRWITFWVCYWSLFNKNGRCRRK